MKELTAETPVKMTVVKVWQVWTATVTAAVIGTFIILSWFYTRENERQLREQEFRH